MSEQIVQTVMAEFARDKSLSIEALIRMALERALAETDWDDFMDRTNKLIEERVKQETEELRTQVADMTTERDELRDRLRTT